MSVDKNKVAQAFAKSYKTYDQHAVVQKELADRLLKVIPQQNFQRVLEIGCGTGYLAQRVIERQKLSEFYINDLSSELCKVTQKRITESHTTPASIHILSGDIEELALPKELHLVFSSSTLQWLENLEKSFSKIYKSLAKNGLFIFSIFTKGTMAETADLTGRGLHYYSEIELKEMLVKNFTLKEIEYVENKLYFNSVIALFKHIRCTGVGAIDDGGKRWTRRLMQDFEEEYRKKYGSKKGLSLSYQAYCFVCKK